MNWEANIITSREGIRALIGRTRRIAVLGIKTEKKSHEPAFYVPAYLAEAGLEIIPVPVYFPEVTQILGRAVYRRLSDVPGEIDLVLVFRRSADLPQHVDDLLEKHPAAVWFQSGIRHDAVAERLARAGIRVVQSRCLMSDHRWL